MEFKYLRERELEGKNPPHVYINFDTKLSYYTIYHANANHYEHYFAIFGLWRMLLYPLGSLRLKRVDNNSSRKTYRVL